MIRELRSLTRIMGRKLNTELDAFPELKPGDVLLYGGTDLVSRAIQFRTWDDVAHVEVYVGANKTVASRNGIGVDLYLFRGEGLRYVRRPNGLTPEEFARGLSWFSQARGLPYGWADLLRFYLVDVPTKGLICSQFAARFFRKCGSPLFAVDYPEGSESPRDFKVTPAAVTFWAWPGAERVPVAAQP